MSAAEQQIPPPRSMWLSPNTQSPFVRRQPNASVIGKRSSVSLMIDTAFGSADTQVDDHGRRTSSIALARASMNIKRRLSTFCAPPPPRPPASQPTVLTEAAAAPSLVTASVPPRLVLHERASESTPMKHNTLNTAPRQSIISRIRTSIIEEAVAHTVAALHEQPHTMNNNYFAPKQSISSANKQVRGSTSSTHDTSRVNTAINDNTNSVIIPLTNVTEAQRLSRDITAEQKSTNALLNPGDYELDDNTLRGATVNTSNISTTEAAITTEDVEASSSSSTSEETEPETPTKIKATIISTIISTLIFAFIYIPFTMCILIQSIIYKRAVHPINWQTELSAFAWKLSFTLFGILFIYPFFLVYIVRTDSGLYDPKYITQLSLILFSLVILHLMTLAYAWMRKDLHILTSNTTHIKLHIKSVYSIASIIFESLQLLSPFMSLIILDKNLVSNSFITIWQTLTRITGISLFSFDNDNNNTVFDYFLFKFWICFAIVIIYALWLGYGIHSNMQPSHPLAQILFSFIPGTLYLTITSSFLSIFNCTQIINNNNNNNYVLSSDSNIQCWDTTLHSSLTMAALMGLLLYSSTAMFVACYRGDGSGITKVKFEVKYKPLYLVIERTLRDLYAISTTLIINSLSSRILSFIILILLFIATIYLKPSNIHTITRLKITIQFLPMWLLFISLINDITEISNKSNNNSFSNNMSTIVIIGWLIAIFLFFLIEFMMEIVWVKFVEKKEETTELSSSIMEIPLLTDPLVINRIEDGSSGSGSGSGSCSDGGSSDTDKEKMMSVEMTSALSSTAALNNGSVNDAVTAIDIAAKRESLSNSDMTVETQTAALLLPNTVAFNDSPTDLSCALNMVTDATDEEEQLSQA